MEKEVDVSLPHLAVQFVEDNTAEEYSLLILLAVLLFSCLSTRIVTGLQSKSQASADSEPHRVRKLPYWIPGVGHAISYFFGHRDFLLKAQKTTNEPVVALQMGLHTQYLVYSPDMVSTLLRSSEARSGIYSSRVMENFVGDRGAFRRLSPQALASIDRTLDPLTNEAYLAKVSAALARVLERETSNFVSFNRSLVDQMGWERNARVAVDDHNNNNNSMSCRVDLFALTRSFAIYTVTHVFMGQALLEFHSQILDDLWLWDRAYQLLMVGAPRWMPSPVTWAAYGARSRVQKTITVLQAALSALDDGRNAPLEFRDLDDVSELMQERMRSWRTLGISTSLASRLDAWLLWKITMDSSKLIFWTIIRIYSDPDLLSNLRKEIAPYVQISHPNPHETGLPIMEPPRISIDTTGKLFANCPLLKATYAETLRLDSNPLPYRQLTANINLTEADEDAALRGAKQPPRSYALVKGDVVGFASGAHHVDPAYYVRPKSFNPDRFLVSRAGGSHKTGEEDEEEAEEERKEEAEEERKEEAEEERKEEVEEERKDPESKNEEYSFDWQTVLPFGGDETFRPLLERQILLTAAAMISLWDIEPSSRQDEEGEKQGRFKIPSHRVSANAYLPSSDVRARLRRRRE